MIQILEEHVSFRYSMMAESESVYKNGLMADSCKQPEIKCFSSFLDFIRTPALKNARRNVSRQPYWKKMQLFYSLLNRNIGINPRRTARELTHWHLMCDFSPVLFIGIFRISCNIVLTRMLEDIADDKSTMVQISGWYHQTTRPLHKSMLPNIYNPEAL